MKEGARVSLKGEGTTRYGWVSWRTGGTCFMACHVTALTHLGTHPVPSTELSPWADTIIIESILFPFTFTARVGERP